MVRKSWLVYVEYTPGDPETWEAWSTAGVLHPRIVTGADVRYFVGQSDELSAVLEDLQALLELAARDAGLRG